MQASFFSVNWIKTLYFNFKMFPIQTAKKLPVFFYGPVKFSKLTGKFIIDAPVERGMVGFGQPYEMTTKGIGIAEIVLRGEIICKGRVQFGKDYFILVDTDAVLSLGNMASMASMAKLICTHKITFNDFARIGSESEVIDTDFHQMINLETNEKHPINRPIILGAYNYIGRRVLILKGTVTPDYCTVASSTLCNKNYSGLGGNVLIGGIPAKLLKTQISRDWEGEHERMLRHLTKRSLFS